MGTNVETFQEKHRSKATLAEVVHFHHTLVDLSPATFSIWQFFPKPSGH